MIKILKKNHNTILTFIIPLILILIGFTVYKDYGISLDEEITRENGIVTIKYLYEFLFPQSAENLKLIQNVPNLSEYWQKQYGTFFEVLVIATIEILLKVKDFSEIFCRFSG